MVVSEQYATAIAEGRTDKTVKQLKNVLDTLAKYGGRYVALRDELHLMKEEEVKIKTKLDQARVDAEQVLPATFRVNAAVPGLGWQQWPSFLGFEAFDLQAIDPANGAGQMPLVPATVRRELCAPVLRAEALWC